MDEVNPDILWEFNTPLSPHQGGFWERLIKEIKKALIKLNHSSEMDMKLFNSIVKEAENILNQRPITNQWDLDDRIVTPNHFLKMKLDGKDLGFASGRFGGKLDKYNEIFQELWKLLTDGLMKREVATRRWLKSHPEFEEREVVIIMDRKNKFGKFPLGIVIDKKCSKDGLQRSVIVRMESCEELEHGIHLLHRINVPISEINTDDAIDKLEDGTILTLFVEKRLQLNYQIYKNDD